MNDYLIHYNHNHDALGRFARSAGSVSSAVGGKFAGKKGKNSTRKYESSRRLASKKVKANNVQAAKKGAKSNNTKLSDSERKRLVESASLKEVTANKDKLSNRELEKAIDRLQKEKISRIDLEVKLADLNNPTNQKNKQTAIEKIDKWGKDAEKLANAINSGTKLYNSFANVYNLGKPDSKKLPRIGNDKDSKKVRPWVQTIIDSGDAVKAAKYASQMTADERAKVSSSVKVMQGLQNATKSEANNNSNPSNDSTKSNEYKSYFNEEQNKTVDSWADVRDHNKQTTQEKSTERAEDILKDYPEHQSGESQKMTDEELKKKYKR